MKKITGFWHLAQVGAIELIWPQQWEKLKQSGLYDISDKIYLNLVGTENIDNVKMTLPDYIINDPKIIFSTQGDRHVFEYSTHKLIAEYSKTHPEEYIYYIHSKGAMTANHEIKNAAYWWGQYMEEYTINRWKLNVESLDLGFDCCGVEWRNSPYDHFSGNFWWATTEYINKLPNIDTYWNQYKHDRIMSEMWIGFGNPRPRIFKNTNQNLYLYSVTPEQWT